MKRLRSSNALVRTKYAGAPHVEQSGISTRQLTAREIERMQAHIDRARVGDVDRPIRLDGAR